MLNNNFIETKEYDFLRENEHLGKYIILLGLGGSYSYGTNNENSDIDLRGIALNQPSDLIGLSSFEQYVDDKTDSCIYGFHKMIQLLMNCNPNTIELLGLKKEHYLYLSPIGNELLEHKSMFLSRRAVRSFGGYASAQLRRLENALARDSYPKVEKEKHICNSIKNAMYDFNRRYAEFEDGSLSIYTDQDDIYLDVNLSHYPLRDYKNMITEMNNIVKDYDKLGKRNRKKDDNHLNKHAMHLIRLFLMAIDILEKGEINTYRENEQEMLLAIRNGKFQKSDGTFRNEFYDLLKDYETRLEYASQHTNLPEEPDKRAIEEFVMSVNERVIRDEL